ncbi:hypothetical protein B0H10DRAFT_1887550 [Mycena sp. CBHHK59/15]|nr:hypothetical protein B0H10DRAFT_1887550 [Mycena sp. CBHHK59/15]
MDQQASSSSSKQTQLHKGKACFNCRRRKVKCDAKKPICGPCARFVGGGLSDCEYTERGPARSQLLEEQISIIESRIQELEHPRAFRTSIDLHDPYSQQGEESGTIALPSLPSFARNSYQERHTSVGPQSEDHPMPIALPRIPRLDLNQPPDPEALVDNLPLGICQALTHNFMRHASQIGLFLDPQILLDLAAGTAPPHAVSPALRHAVCLWGARLTRSPALSAHEPAFLAAALRSAARTLPHAVLHTAQAEVLLAAYFFRAARVLEGKYHAGAAASIVLSAGLHRMRSPMADVGKGTLPPPAAAREEGERVNAFWAVLTLNNCWTTADGSPANISYAAHGVDTPWPHELYEYSENPGLLPAQSSGTIDKFLANILDDGTAVPALHAKAAILFEQASRLAARYSDGITRHDQPPPFSDEFSALDGVIAGFKLGLPRAASRTLLVTHTLAHVATIQLHNPFCLGNRASRGRVLTAAHAVVALLGGTDVQALGFVDAIMGTLWTAACQVFITELSRARYSSPARATTEELGDSVETLVGAMAVFASDSRLIEMQLDSVKKSYAAVRNA